MNSKPNEETQEPETVGTILQSAGQSTSKAKNERALSDDCITSPTGQYAMRRAPQGLPERLRKRDKDAERLRRDGLWEDIVKKIGPRYVDCRVSNFKRHGIDDEQKRQGEILKRVEEYSSQLPNQKTSRNVVFFGPCGTGKDHLMVGLMYEATMNAGRSANWINGLDLFGEVRDGFNRQKSEGDLLRELATPDILAISDPLPPFGGLTDFQASFLLRLIDRRYRNMKPTWITANFKDGDDADKPCSPQIIDRLKDGALVCDCFWPSYRNIENKPDTKDQT